MKRPLNKKSGLLLPDFMFMMLLILFSLSFFICLKSAGQPVPDGLWNAGGVIIPTFSANAGHSQPLVRKPFMYMDLYPGISVVKSGYQVNNPDSLPMECLVELRDSGRFKESTTGIAFIRQPAVIKAFLNDTLVTPVYNRLKGTSNWTFTIPGHAAKRFTIYLLTENYQSKLVSEGNSREANAMVIVNENPQQISADSFNILVRLKESLSTTNILGLSPAKKIYGDVTHLYYDLRNIPLVIWYEGAPGDFNFEKKILPKADVLFADIDQFTESEFSGNSLALIDKYNFSTNPKNPLAAILYFIMFFAPWFFLAGFIVFLLRKPKKKDKPV
jgi:hypothetical protein